MVRETKAKEGAAVEDDEMLDAQLEETYQDQYASAATGPAEGAEASGGLDDFANGFLDSLTPEEVEIARLLDGRCTFDDDTLYNKKVYFDLAPGKEVSFEKSNGSYVFTAGWKPACLARFDVGRTEAAEEDASARVTADNSRRAEAVALGECLDKFTEHERLSSDNMWYVLWRRVVVAQCGVACGTAFLFLFLFLTFIVPSTGTVPVARSSGRRTRSWRFGSCQR
jgi:hypothetical protein